MGFKTNRIGISCVLAFFVQPNLWAAPQTLETSFRSALSRSEVIGTQIELINQAEERYRQSIGAVLPSISLVGSYLLQEQPEAASQIFPNSQPLLKFQASQPIFRGLRELAVLRQTKHLKEAQTEDARQARVLLFNDVAQNFFTILNLEKILKNYNEQVTLYDRRIEDLRKRIKIGRSRESEVLTVQASLSAINAQIETIQGQLKVAREAYRFLTGLTEDVVLNDDQPLVRNLPSMDFYLNGLSVRPDVKATESRRDAAEESIAIAKGARLPTIDFTANYYMKRFGATENVNWDVQFLASLPLYAGGRIDSGIREATSVMKQNELAVSRSRRLADQEIRSLYKQYEANREQIEALRKNKAAAELNLKTQNNDYRLGLVTNLDVLSALIQYQESQRALDQAIFSAKLDYVRLENAAAKNPLILD